jgi:hypothetical protein
MKNFNDSKFLEKIKKMYQEESASNLKYLDPTRLFPENSVLNNIRNEKFDKLDKLEKLEKTEKSEKSEKPSNPFLEASLRAEALQKEEANLSSEQDQSFNSNTQSPQEPNVTSQPLATSQNSQFVINNNTSFNTTSTSTTFKAEKKGTPNFAKTTEENLRKELESILLQVYLEHINKSKDFDIKVFENHVSYYLLKIFNFSYSLK